MQQRINPFEKGQAAMRSMFATGSYLAKCNVEQHLFNLLFFRVSQINGCAYCLDMHSKDLRANGETEQRLHMIAGWREATVYSDRERAAFAWAEAVTLVTEGHVPDEVYNEAALQFTQEEIIDLTLAVTTINSWNRLNVAFRTPGGSYQVGQHAH